MVVGLIKKLGLLRNYTNKSYITFGRALHLEAEFKKGRGGRFCLPGLAKI